MADTDDSIEKRRAYQREYMRKWKAANPEKVRAIARKSRERNKVKRAATARAWKLANRDKLRAWREANKEKVNAQKRALRKADPDKFATQDQAWRIAHPERTAFMRHRSAARGRGIPFLMTFDEWWEVWRASGKWPERGRHKGQYCMARFRDLGAYETGNVRIILGRENLAEMDQSYRSKPRSDEWRKHLSEGVSAYYARVRHSNETPLGAK
jgi:hypothetical protein